MLFNLGFTADAAAAHRHEFSQQTEAKEERQPSEKKLTFPMALPSMPDIYPFRSSSKPTVDSSSSITAQPTRPTPPLSAKSSHPSIVYPSSSDEEDAAGGDSQAAAPTSAVRHSLAVRKHSARSKTIFQFAHPVTSHRRLTLRPKLLLQLHENSNMSRPFPKYDVLPASVAPRLACKFPKLFGSLRGLGPRDLVIVTSDMYEQHALGDDDRSVSSEESSQDQREVVATICQPIIKDEAQRTCKVEIVSSSGVSWEGTLLHNGSYELVSNGGLQQRKVRWVARDKGGTRRVSNMSNFSPASNALKRFTFSVIDPNSRRHPVLASMTRHGIDVFEQYSYPAAASSSDDTGSPSPLNVAAGESQRELIKLEDELRVLIVTSGIWIAFMEGWAKNPTYGDATSIAESQLSLRSKSSTFPGGERDSPNDRLAPAQGDSSTRKKKANRRSTQSDIGALNETNVPGRSVKSRHRHSMAAETHDQKWTNLNKVEPGEETGSDLPHGDDPKMKGKTWRRFGSIFGRRKR